MKLTEKKKLTNEDLGLISAMLISYAELVNSICYNTPQPQPIKEQYDILKASIRNMAQKVIDTKYSNEVYESLHGGGEK